MTNQASARPRRGVDGVTWQDYEEGLERKLEGLHQRVQSGAYWALPVRREYIPKSDGKQRPLGIAALEDKIVQIIPMETNIPNLILLPFWFSIILI